MVVHELSNCLQQTYLIPKPRLAQLLKQEDQVESREFPDEKAVRVIGEELREAVKLSQVLVLAGNGLVCRWSLQRKNLV